ncbi:hypothetical protein CPB84DRAFT_1751327 [Gymnopilus junonius]|uniref:Uncharacterized protein n=1 Tax=Gymnopilus junonius TaxID=109634 RepID=A0A9P5THA1_GYMJU|nr:hypothetical protein CPB84DRAFT_1751327 [Gymnopilus junonius]
MCRLRLGLKAPALAWLELASAFPNLEPGQKPKIRLGLAWLWPRPGLLAYAWKYCIKINEYIILMHLNTNYKVSENCSRMLSLTQLEMCSRRTVTKVLIQIETQPDIPEVHKRIRPLALAFRNAGPGQKPSQAKPQGPAWPGLFWLGPARLLASGRSRHITTQSSARRFFADAVEREAPAACVKMAAEYNTKAYKHSARLEALWM